MTITLNEIIQDSLNGPAYKNGLYFDAITLSNHLKDEYFRKPMREDGVIISIGTEFFAEYENRFVDNIVYYENDFTLVDTDGYYFNYQNGERPEAPRRVKDYDGINIEVGDTVYAGATAYSVVDIYYSTDSVSIQNATTNGKTCINAKYLSHTPPRVEFETAADVVNYIFNMQVDEDNIDEYIYRLAEIVKDIKE